MKARICVIPDSFDFNDSIENTVTLLNSFNKVRSKMASDFVNFSRSSDFYVLIADQLYSESIDSGWAMNLFFEGMSNFSMIELDADSIINIININPPTFEERWINIFSSNESLNKYKKRAILSESDLTHFCTDILSENKRDHVSYAEHIQQIYKNIIFLNHPNHKTYKNFDSIRKMDGGYKNFQGAVSRFLCFVNCYNVIPHDSQRNIDNINSSLEFPVTAEGKGKNIRKIKALKRDFFLDNIEYQNVNCEYHYKLEKYDNSNGNGTYYFNRIYFGFFNRIDQENPKISIAHIGEHL